MPLIGLALRDKLAQLVLLLLIGCASIHSQYTPKNILAFLWPICRDR
jgi:hypothetical protein